MRHADTYRRTASVKIAGQRERLRTKELATLCRQFINIKARKWLGLSDRCGQLVVSPARTRFPSRVLTCSLDAFSGLTVVRRPVESPLLHSLFFSRRSALLGDRPVVRKKRAPSSVCRLLPSHVCRHSCRAIDSYVRVVDPTWQQDTYVEFPAEHEKQRS